MKLLFACADRVSDRQSWSGTVWNCCQALQHAGIEVALCDEIPFQPPLRLRILHQLHRRLGRRVHYLQIEPAALRRAARHVEQRFARHDCDAVFCLGTGVPLHTHIRPDIPVFTYLDATKRSWIAAYHGLASLCGRSRRHVDVIDRTGLRHNRLSIFSSDWAAREARRDYGVAAARSPVVPFGANIADPPPPSAVEAAVRGRSATAFRCLFLGKEWERKGGPAALAVVRELRTRGLDVSLDIAGCSPELAPDVLPFTRRHGFIDHSTLQGRRAFRELLAGSHVLLFFSRAEAFGIALCDAAAFGVPALAAAVGGIATVVRPGRNGWLTPAPIRPEHAADTLEGILRAPELYRRVALAARTDYEGRLNWRSTGDALRGLIGRALEGPGGNRP